MGVGVGVGVGVDMGIGVGVGVPLALLVKRSATSRHAPGKCSLKKLIRTLRIAVGVRVRFMYRTSASKRASPTSFSAGHTQEKGSRKLISRAAICAYTSTLCLSYS